MVVVDMSYEGALTEYVDSTEKVLDFYLDRGEINGSKELQTPETTNYYYAGYDASAQNSQMMTLYLLHMQRSMARRQMCMMWR